MSNLSVVGRMSKLYGEGILLNLYNNFPSQFNTKEPLFVIIDKLEVPLFLNSFTRKGNSSAVVCFDDIDTEYRMSELLGMDVLFPCTESEDEYDEPSDDAIYFEDLEGWEAVLTNEHRGSITKFIDGENPLLLIDIEGKEVFIPAQDEFFEDFDTQNKVVFFCLPEGLLDLYI